jgi:hypothetical protein
VAVARKYVKHFSSLHTATRHIIKHKKEGHIGKRPPTEQSTGPGTLTDIKAARHRQSIEERIDELYELSLAGSKLALTKANPDLRGLAACIAQGVAVTELMGKHESADTTKGKSAIIAFVESERAKE